MNDLKPREKSENNDAARYRGVIHVPPVSVVTATRGPLSLAPGLAHFKTQEGPMNRAGDALEAYVAFWEGVYRVSGSAAVIAVVFAVGYVSAAVVLGAWR